jgi:uncharacterized damage-inducible protein DinB
MASGHRRSEVALLLRLLDESYERKAWQGPNLRGCLRGVTAQQAGWRPTPGRHNIWELLLHAAYWKYATWRMLVGERRGSFPEKGSNWFARPVSPTERAWRADLALLELQHRRLREAVKKLTDAELARKKPGSKYTTDNLVYGIASHDVYHTGQIQLMKRLWRDRKKLGGVGRS